MVDFNRKQEPENPWEGAEVIFSYSRADAIRDGVLVDWTKEPLASLCRQAGFRLPIAMTDGAWAACIGSEPFPQGQSVAGRAWDVLAVLRAAIRRNRNTDRVDFKVRVWDGPVANGQQFRTVDLWCHCGPGDTAEPVLTIMLEGEDYVRSDGLAVRPTLAVCDDPQTDASSKSALQTFDRLSIISGAVGGLAGPGKRTAVIIPCTVIHQGDLADQLLNRVQNPEYQGERTKLLYAFPKNEALWAEYKEVRNAGILAGDGGKAGNEFYTAHREAMDEATSICERPHARCRTPASPALLKANLSRVWIS
jgi:hypothetical protein